MKERRYKRRKVNWYQVILDENLVDEFKTWCSGKKTMSFRKLTYMFVKHIKGNEFCVSMCRVYTDRLPKNNESVIEKPKVSVTYETEEFTEQDAKECNAIIAELASQKTFYGL